MPSTPAPRLTRLRNLAAGETTGGALLIVAALLALALANSPWREAYADLSELTVGPAALHLDLSLAQWAADGLLAVFFFTVGLELKHEFVAGSLRNPREAGVPMIAAVGGMVVPALLYVAVVATTDAAGAMGGWAIPTATDIAFALAVLSVFGKGLPIAVRLFLLTLAVVDDLLAITVIALFYTDGIDLLWLGLAAAVIALFGWHVRSSRPRWWVLVPLFVLAWALMHASGVHATVAGVILGFTVAARPVRDEPESRVHHYEHAVKPWSQGLALPVFAFFAAGVSLLDGGGLGELLGQPVVLATALGLVLGKVVGVLGVTWAVTRVTPLRLAPGIGVRDLLPVALLAGIGFTVSLLVAELSFAHGSEQLAGAKVGVLGASAVAAVLGAVLLRWDARRARSEDMNRDGIPDEVRERIGED